MTIKQKIINKLKADGEIDNFYCLENKITLRLASFINVLRKEGWEIHGNFIKGTKNWRYTLAKPVERYKWVDYEVDGERVSRRVLISGDEIRRDKGQVLDSIQRVHS